MAHAPPLTHLLPDADVVRRAEQDISRAHHRAGSGAGMALFIDDTCRQGELAEEFFDRAAPEPPALGEAPWHARAMPPSAVDPPFDQFLVAADSVARARPEVDLMLAREVFLEAATLLHNGLALDGLGTEDAQAVVAGLCVDLVSEDPGAAVRARAEAASRSPGDLLDPQGVSAAYLSAAAILQL